jgi:hypothetical protein
MLRDNYQRNWVRVKDSKDDLAWLEAAGKWLAVYHKDPDCFRYLTHFMVVLIMRSYRKEVFSRLKQMVRPEHYEQAAKGNVMLCQAELNKVLTPESAARISCVNGDLTKTRSIEDLVSLIWGMDDQIRRDRWENLAFRIYCRGRLSWSRPPVGQRGEPAFTSWSSAILLLLTGYSLILAVLNLYRETIKKIPSGLRFTTGA